ncbi:hypothetical protein BSK54_10310 [Paenibacillus odorifer]|uniref:hypothetical protein n=1 Tax=Paenibacillus odorifer TaxID=189426 RepID=UPI00096CDBA9|nr:hypothetical protein [Paenibacillus odorifer]OME02642.1 hypothetical protein BSK54_10310 [Paenibacillus odorifer]
MRKKVKLVKSNGTFVSVRVDVKIRLSKEICKRGVNLRRCKKRIKVKMTTDAAYLLPFNPNKAQFLRLQLPSGIRNIRLPQNIRKKLPEVFRTPTITRRPHPSTKILKLRIGFIILPGAKADARRIQRDIRAAEQIWKNTEIINTGILTLRSEKDFLNAETMTESQRVTNAIQLASQAKKLYQVKGPFGRTFTFGIPPSIIVIYVAGDHFPRKPTGLPAAWAFGGQSSPNFIYITNGTKNDSYFFAHEVGHILYFTNSSGSIVPDPTSTSQPKSGHSGISGNVMYPSHLIGTIPTVTNSQINVARQSKLLR